MRFYVTEARSWASSSREAYRLAQEDGSKGEYGPIEVPTDKPGLLAFLIQWCGLAGPPRDGEGDRPQDGAGAPAPADDLAFRNQLAERWDSLPLPFCLDLAALALDRARPLARLEQERTH